LLFSFAPLHLCVELFLKLRYVFCSLQQYSKHWSEMKKIYIPALSLSLSLCALCGR
jgi:hypothetical protein